MAAADFGLPLTGDLGRAEVASRASTPRRPPSRTRAWVTRGASGTRTMPTGRAAPPDAAGARGLTLPGTRPGRSSTSPGAGDHPRRVRWTGARLGKVGAGRSADGDGPDHQRRLGPPPEAPMRPARARRGALTPEGGPRPVVRRRGAGRASWLPVVWRDAAAPAPPRSRREACRRPRPPPVDASSTPPPASAEGPAAQWASGLCAALAAWEASVRTQVTRPGPTPTVTGQSPSERLRGEVRARLNGVAEATDQLRSELEQLGAPGTAAGTAVKEELSGLSARLKAHVADLGHGSRTGRRHRAAAGPGGEGPRHREHRARRRAANRRPRQEPRPGGRALHCAGLRTGLPGAPPRAVVRHALGMRAAGRTAPPHPPPVRRDPAPQLPSSPRGGEVARRLGRADAWLAADDTEGGSHDRTPARGNDEGHRLGGVGSPSAP